MDGYEDLQELMLARLGGDGDKELARFPGRFPVEQIRLQIIGLDGDLVPHRGARRNMPCRSAFAALSSRLLFASGPLPRRVPAQSSSPQHTKPGKSCM